MNFKIKRLLPLAPGFTVKKDFSAEPYPYRLILGPDPGASNPVEGPELSGHKTIKQAHEASWEEWIERLRPEDAADLHAAHERMKALDASGET